jgi:hypothetical protein
VDKTILLFVLGLFLFASPLIHWWAGPHAPWYLPYLLWGGFIALIVWLQLSRSRHDL